MGAPPARPSGNGPAVPRRGSSKARLRCTGPAPVTASTTDRAPIERHPAVSSRSAGPGSKNHRTAPPYRLDCSMVWGAPTPCRRGGRSAVQTINGTPAWLASTTPAWSSAAAVPLVVQTTLGTPVATANPTAKKHAPRSSSRTCSSISSRSARASTSGVEREPGQTTAWVTPARTHSSTSVAAKVAWASAVATLTACGLASHRVGR